MDAVELPPSSFFLTDLLPILFLACLCCLPSSAEDRTQQLLADLHMRSPSPPGSSIPCLLMLTAISMNYRYRMEFYPLIDLLAFLGLYITVVNRHTLCDAPTALALVPARHSDQYPRAFVEMILYKLSVFGPAQQLLRQGLVHYYST